MAEYTRLEELQCLVSDMYKDAHGFRPRHYSNKIWNSEEELEKIASELEKEVVIAIQEETERFKLNAEKFENKLSELINIGASNRSTAIQWLIDAENDPYMGDVGYFCYSFGLEYDYIKFENGKYI